MHNILQAIVVPFNHGWRSTFQNRSNLIWWPHVTSQKWEIICGLQLSNPKQSNVFSMQDDVVQLDQDLIFNHKETCILALWSPQRTIPLLLQCYASFCYCTSQSQRTISVTTSPRVTIASSCNDPDPSKIDLGLSLQRLMGFSFGCCSDVLINYRQLWKKKDLL